MVNKNDMDLLCNSIDYAPYHQDRLVGGEIEEIRIYGIKIIESQYIQSGSIFPVFKEGTKGMALMSGFSGPGDETWGTDIPPIAKHIIPISGSIPISKYWGTIPESGSFNPNPIPVIPGSCDIFSKSTPITTPNDEKEVEKKKHSKTRKIELD